jgi:hypothetical protein
VVTPKKPAAKGLVRSTILNSSHEVTPVEGRPDACRMTIVACVDPGGSIPKMVLNKAAPMNAMMVHRISKLAEVGNRSKWPALEANTALVAAQAQDERERVVLNAVIVEDGYHRGRTEVLELDGTVVAAFEPLVRLTAKNAACICDGIREQAGLMHFVVIDGSSGREVAAS